MKIRFIKIIGLIIMTTILSLQTIPVFGQSYGSDIDVNLTVGSDTDAPSVPTDLTADAISTSQINLSWTASTDNFAVDFYNIFRDSVFLASTSAIIYSDTGLSSGTEYAYTVSAVDTFANESNRSATTTATTLSPTVVVEDQGVSGGGGIIDDDPELISFQSLVSENTSLLTIESDREVSIELSWGLTTDYETGTIFLSDREKVQTVLLTNLLAGNTYFVEIKLKDRFDRMGIFERSFKTPKIEIAETLANVRNPRISQVGQEEKLRLMWDLPQQDFDAIRVVRSQDFYPTNPFDGEVVFEGKAGGFVDSVSFDTRYYYTIFVQGTDGAYSSGVVVQGIAIPEGAGEDRTVIDLFGQDQYVGEINPLIEDLTMADFEFIQDGRQLFVGDDRVEIDSEKSLYIRIPYEKLPEVLKTISITLESPENKEKVFTFLLRINNEKTYYEATIGSLEESGSYGVYIHVIDYKNQAVRQLRSILLALNLKQDNLSVLDRLFNFADRLGLLIGLLVLFFALCTKRQKQLENCNC